MATAITGDWGRAVVGARSLNKNVAWPRWLLLGAGLALAVVRLLPMFGCRVWWAKDAFVYACLADNLDSGHGFTADYVLHHYVKYTHVTGRPEDFVAPLLSIAIVPWLKLFGRSLGSYAAICVLLHCLVLPLLLRAIALRLGARPLLANALAWLTLCNPKLMLLTQTPLTDVPFACLVLLAVYWCLRPGERLRDSLVAAVFVGLAGLTRLAGLILVPAFMLVLATRRRPRRAAWLEAALFAGVVLLIASPWLVRNWVVFGSPMHSLYQYQAGLLGRSDHTYAELRQVWWDRQLPSTLSRYWAGPAAHPWRHLRHNLIACLAAALTGCPLRFKGLVLMLMGGLPALIALWHGRHEAPARLWVLLALLQSVATAVLFGFVTDRYFLSIVALTSCFATVTWDGWAHRLPSRLINTVVVLLCLIGLCFGLRDYEQLRFATSRQVAEPMVRLLHKAQSMVGPEPVWLCDPTGAMVHYYTGQPAVTEPLAASSEVIEQLIEQYHCNAILARTGLDLDRYAATHGWSRLVTDGAWVAWREPPAPQLVSAPPRAPQ